MASKEIGADMGASCHLLLPPCVAIMPHSILRRVECALAMIGTRRWNACKEARNLSL